jgi:DNA processing protein
VQDQRAAERLARAVWSAIAEPGDVVLAPVLAHWGAAAALDWLAGAVSRADAAVAEVAFGWDVASAAKLRTAVERWGARLGPAVAADALTRRARAVGARVVIPGDPEWPEALDDLGGAAPPALWVRGAGDLGKLLSGGVGIVGSRASSQYGEHVAAALAAGLADAGLSTISGGAYGIDAAAHRACLAAGRPTVAFMAGGVDRLYPAGNATLLERILVDGLVVSEVPPGYAPHRSRFLSRNRLIAAARGTVVVEAAYRSGALTTARFAADLSRPVGAVPGPVTQASFAGCHRLIRDGAAVLVTSAQDVAELVMPVGEGLSGDGNPGADSGREEFATPYERQVFDALGVRGSTSEVLPARAGLTAAEVRVALGGLEAVGLIERRGATWNRTDRKKRT